MYIFCVVEVVLKVLKLEVDSALNLYVTDFWENQPKMLRTTFFSIQG